MSPTEILIPIEVLTATYRVVGKVRIRSTGLWAVIHDKTTDYLEMIEAKVASLAQPRTLTAVYHTLSIAKVGIHAIGVAKPSHLGPPGRVYNAEGKRPHSVWGVTQVFEIQGTFYWRGPFSSAAILADYKDSFLPLFDAQLRTAVLATYRLKAPALLVNRNKLDLFTPLSARLSSTTEAPSSS